MVVLTWCPTTEQSKKQGSSSCVLSWPTILLIQEYQKPTGTYTTTNINTTPRRVIKELLQRSYTTLLPFLWLLSVMSALSSAFTNLRLWVYSKLDCGDQHLVHLLECLNQSKGNTETRSEKRKAGVKYNIYIRSSRTVLKPVERTPPFRTHVYLFFLNQNTCKSHAFLQHFHYHVRPIFTS